MSIITTNSLLRQIWHDPVAWKMLRKGVGDFTRTAGITVFVVFAIIKIGDWLLGNYKPEPTLETRISELSTLLISSAQRISEIEGEVKQRQALVAKLENDAETAKRLSAVSRDQAEAIAQTLRGELKRQSDYHWWSENWLHLMYTLLGFLVAELYHFLLKPRIDRWRTR